MVNDKEARDAVRQLMKRFDLINAQRLSMAYVLAEQDAAEYAKLLVRAEEAERTVIQPLMASEPERGKLYASLDNSNADWPKAVMELLQSK